MKSKFLHERRKELLNSRDAQKNSVEKKVFRLSELPEKDKKEYDDVYSEAHLKKIDGEVIDLLIMVRKLNNSVSKFSDHARRNRLKALAPEFDFSKFLNFLSFSESVLKKERNRLGTLISDRERILSVYASTFGKV